MVNFCNWSIYDIIVLFEPLLFLSYCTLPGVVLDAGNAGSRSLERRLAKDDLEIRGGDGPMKSFIIFKERFVL